MNQNELYDLISQISDIEENKNIVEAGRISHVEINESRIYVLLAIPFSSEKSFQRIKRELESLLKANADEGQNVLVGMTARKETPAPTPATATSPAASASPPQAPSFQAKHIIAVGSGKGGVGKSTIAMSIAVALSKFHNLSVGILDTDIHGPSIAHLMAINTRPEVKNNKIIPHQKWGVSAMSMGMLVENNAPSVLRGPMMARAIEQMIDEVEWPLLDYLIIDFPPGTGDVHLSTARKIKINGCVIVSTPQDLALIDAKKMISMCQKLNVPILGCIENMSGFICPHCKKESDIFGKNGLERETQKLHVPFLGRIPLDPSVRDISDKGDNLLVSDPNHLFSVTMNQITDTIIASVTINS